MRCATRESVAGLETTSTNRIAGAGLKKCMPAKLCGRAKAAAMAASESDDVLVAMTASMATIFSTRVNNSRLTCKSSATASITNAQSLNRFNSAHGSRRATNRAAARASMRPRLIRFSKLARMESMAARWHRRCGHAV